MSWRTAAMAKLCAADHGHYGAMSCPCVRPRGHKERRHLCKCGFGWKRGAYREGRSDG